MVDNLDDTRERAILVDVFDDYGFFEMAVACTILLLDNRNGFTVNYGRGVLLDKNCSAPIKWRE